MKTSDLSFTYPLDLVATEPHYPPRVMGVLNSSPEELTFQQLLEVFQAGDVLVVNNTRVIPCRVKALDLRGNKVDVLFIKRLNSHQWEVLYPASKYKKEKLMLPEQITLEWVQGGLPQKIQLSQEIDGEYFFRHGEAPLPPYILKAREELGLPAQSPEDQNWYQSLFAQELGSTAAPTASLHFKSQDLEYLKLKGVEVLPLTLHVGLGTFLPVTVENLEEHPMHKEWVHIPQKTWDGIQKAKQGGHRIWALGTTVTRALESTAAGLLGKDIKGWVGETQLFIKPGHSFQVIDVLLTNFHQPESTLLALVSAFKDLKTVKTCYQWAMEKQFRLFSYGDLTVWFKAP